MKNNLPQRHALRPDFLGVIKGDYGALQNALKRSLSPSRDVVIVRSERPENDMWKGFRDIAAQTLADHVRQVSKADVYETKLSYDTENSAKLTYGSRVILERHAMGAKEPDVIEGRQCIVFGFDAKSGGRLADMASTIVENGGMPLFCFCPHSSGQNSRERNLAVVRGVDTEERDCFKNLKTTGSKPLLKLVKLFQSKAIRHGQNYNLEEAAWKLNVVTSSIGLPLYSLTAGEVHNMKDYIRDMPDHLFFGAFINFTPQ